MPTQVALANGERFNVDRAVADVQRDVEQALTARGKMFTVLTQDIGEIRVVPESVVYIVAVP